MLDTEEPETRRRRAGERGPARGLIALVVFLVVLAGVIAPLGWFWHAVGSSGSQQPVSFTVASGASGTDIASSLEERGIIRSSLGFRLLAKVRGVDINYQAGEYPLATNMSAGAVLDAMAKGPVTPEGVTLSFPEGLRLEEVAAHVQRDLGIDRTEFLEAARSGRYSLPPYLPEGTSSAEGFLFPNTYEVRADATADDVIERLLDEFQSEAEGLPWDSAPKLGVTPYQVVVVASMIEREARFAQDRAKIAAVIYNRLKKGMPLQIDATVQYALGSWDKLTTKDYKVDSPYNTYQIQDLPPGPICNPGLASIEAALEPAKKDYLYYVVIDAKGHHGFTSSYQRFLELKDQYRG
jgi:UPF0755 protein